MQKVSVMGIPFDSVNMEEAAELAFSYIENGTQAVAVTPNAEILYLCMRDESVRQAVCSAQIILPDGEGALWAAKRLGTPLACKVAGVDFGVKCAERAAKTGKSIFLLGGKPGVAEKAAHALRVRFPSLKTVGTANGYFAKEGEESSSVIRRINESGADILYVCLGAPAQEKWVYENRALLTAPRLILCLGGSLDIYAGTAKRAPSVFIRLRLEWFYRLLRDPRRIGRMMRLPAFMLSVYKHKFKTKKTRYGK